MKFFFITSGPDQSFHLFAYTAVKTEVSDWHLQADMGNCGVLMS